MISTLQSYMDDGNRVNYINMINPLQEKSDNMVELNPKIIKSSSISHHAFLNKLNSLYNVNSYNYILRQDVKEQFQEVFTMQAVHQKVLKRMNEHHHSPILPPRLHQVHATLTRKQKQYIEENNLGQFMEDDNYISNGNNKESTQVNFDVHSNTNAMLHK